MLTESTKQQHMEQQAAPENGAPANQKQYREVYEVANRLFQQDPDWVTFFREVLGIGGVVRQAFPKPEQMAAFEQTSEHDEIQQMLAKLRERSSSAGVADGSKEPTRVITVRLPQSLHESLRHEAHERRTSMNKLCISKLLQIVDEEFITADSE